MKIYGFLSQDEAHWDLFLFEFDPTGVANKHI